MGEAAAKPEPWRPQSKQVIGLWLNTIDRFGHLTEWEAKFVQSMKLLIQWGWSLSQAQEEKLKAIYEEKTR